MPGVTIFLLLFLAIFMAIWLIGDLLVRRGQVPQLRSLPAYETIRGAMATAAEAGRPVHLSLGTAGVADAFAMETVAGLLALDFLSEQAAVTTNLPLVSTADPTTLLLAQDILSRPFKQREQLADYDPLSVRFIGGTPGTSAVAYAAGVMDILDHRYVASNVMLGRFADEYLLIGEVGARNNIPQVAGSANPDALALMRASANQVLIGEELFAASAYLSRSPWDVAGLIAQDAARWIMVGAVGAVVLLKSIGML